MRFERILFDVSGTLWDDLDQVFIANYNVLMDGGYHCFPETDEPLSIEGLKSRAVGSCVEMFRSFGMKGSDEELTEKYVCALDEVASKYPVKLYDGVDTLIQSLDGKVPKIVISAHPQHRLEEDLDKVGIYDEFEKIIGNCHHKCDTIQKNVKNITPYVGDTKGDIIHARNAGAVPLAVTYGYGKLDDILKENPHKHFNCAFTLRDYLLERV